MLEEEKKIQNQILKELSLEKKKTFSINHFLNNNTLRKTALITQGLSTIYRKLTKGVIGSGGRRKKKKEELKCMVLEKVHWETGLQGSRCMVKEQEEELQHFVLDKPKLADNVKEGGCRS